MKFEIEITRHNVTPAQFLAYVRNRVDAKGGAMLRSDLALDYFRAGNDLNFATTRDGIREKSISKPYEMQTFVEYENGAMYNEICEFTFDDDKTGTGYYYLVNVERTENAVERVEETDTTNDTTTEETPTETPVEPQKHDNLTPYERVIAKNPDCKNAWRLPGYPGPVYTIQYKDARGGWYSCHYPSFQEYRDDLERIAREGGQIEKTTKTEAGVTEAIPAETRQEKTDRENRATCMSIARAVELYAYGNAWKCPHCGEVNHLDDIYEEERENEYICPDCGEVIDRDELENLTLYDYFSDCMDIEYRCGSDRKYRSARIMVACGGPNIYIDTATKNVELYWWTDRATYPLSSDAVDAVNDWAEEYFNMI